MLRLRLITISLVVTFFIFSPVTSVKAFDARCFTFKQCETQAGFATNEGDIEQFFYDSLDAQISCGVEKNAGKNAAGERVGFCLAAGQATTKIAIGGRRNFSDLGQFIKYGYEYGMWVAGILATTMLIIAGFQWLTSGGNSDSIGSAKKKIAGAVTGLLLLSLSYVVLNSINPYLVELRLPKTWMINTAQMAQPFCADVENTTLAYLGPDGAAISDEEKNKKFSDAELNGYPIDPTVPAVPGPDGLYTPETTPICGHRYLVKDTAGQSCIGDICSPDATFPRSCLPFDIVSSGSVFQKDVRNVSTCWRGSLIIRYTVGDILQGFINLSTKNLAGPIEQSDDDFWLQDRTWASGQSKKIKLALVCENLVYGDLKMAPFLIETNQLVPVTQILNPNGYDQFIIQYYNDAADGSGTLEKLFEPYINDVETTCAVTAEEAPHRRVAGFFVLNKINDNYDGDDGIVFIGVDKTTNKAAGYVHPFASEDDGDGYSSKYLSYSNIGTSDDPAKLAEAPQPTWIKNFIPIRSVTEGRALFLDFTLTNDIMSILNK